MESIEAAIRAFVKGNTVERSSLIYFPSFSRLLFLDSETTSDQYQNLIFGSYKLYENYILVGSGIYYDPKFVNKREIEILRQHDKIIPVRKFVDDIFLPEIYDRQSLCVGFNLPFDLSRLAIDFGYGRKSNNGAFSLKLSEDKKYPRLIIRSIDSTKSFIKFGTSGLTDLQLAGNFLDLRTLSFALSSEKHTLESACKFFYCPIKKYSTNEHGKITKRYVKYNQNDVDATHSLYVKLVKEYKKYNLTRPITKIYSPASIGKALLDDIGILPFYQISKVSLVTLGLLMSTYIGSRTEVRIRLHPLLVRYLDFLSMYPTVCILQDLWSFVIAEEVYEQDCTEWTRQFMSKIALDDLNNPQIWKELSVIVCVRPDHDILPIRAKYGNKHAYNIGLNHVTSKGILWFCLADVIASKILTGKTPEIVKAIRFIPKGTQKLKEISILGEKINPRRDVFKKIIEKREELKDIGDPQEHILKIIANSTSYGIYAQINIENRKSQVDVYSLEHFEAFTNKSERQGERFNPILATFITSGSRLILAIVEAILVLHGKTHAFCDTDSMAIPSDMVDIIQNYFQKLNPYCFDKPLFKLEEENFDEKGNLFGLWFFGISSKRYVLYNMVDGKIVIRKHSSHGLGHLKDPFSSEDWEKEFWTDILEYHYKIKSIDEINEKYSGYYAVSQMTISTPNLLRRFGKLNKGKPYEKKIKPFNFCLVGFGNEAVKPLCAYKKDSQEAVFDEFIDYGSGQVMSGLQYWQNLSQIFWDYLNHKESKFDGNTGILTRKNLLISSIAVIGKESNDLEENEVFGLDDETYLKYQNNKIPIEKALNLTPKKAKIIGISKNQLLRIKRAIRRKSCNFRTKTLQKLTRID